MGIKKFIENVKEFLELDEFQQSGKKKSIKNLLKKLNLKKDDLQVSLKTELENKERTQLEEELAITSIHIKKGEAILNKLKE